MGSQAELQEGLLQLGREMKSEVLALLSDQNVCSCWVMEFTVSFYGVHHPSLIGETDGDSWALVSTAAS